MATPVRVTTFLVALVVFYCAFRWGLAPFGRPLPDAVFRFTPPDVVWPLPSMVLAIIAADVVGGALLRRFFPGHSVHETSESPFVRWAQRHARPIYAVGAVIALQGAWLASQWSVFLTPSSILIHPFWDFHTRRYRYEDVTFIGSAPVFIAPLGNQVPRRELVVRFRDGTGWSTVDSPRRCTPQQVEELAGYVSERSSVPVTEMSTLSRRDW